MDEGMVYQIMELLSGYGCRLWYDAGIPVGSEFPEIIAEHLVGAEVCIAFLSNKYMESAFCRDELNFALKKKKKMIILYLEQVQLTFGFEMRLDMIQSIFAYKKSNLDSVVKEVYLSKILAPCIASMPEEIKKENLIPEKDGNKNNRTDIYLCSLKVLEQAKGEKIPELRGVIYELKKINGFLRNEIDFDNVNLQVMDSEYLIRQKLEAVSEELDVFACNEDKKEVVARMMKYCMEILLQLKIRSEQMKNREY